MPSWFWTFLIDLAVKLGLPWLMAKFPWLPKELKDIIEELLKNIGQLNDQKVLAVRTAKRKIRAHCSGVACVTDTLKD